MNEAVSGIALGVVIVGLALSTFVTRTSFLLAGARFRLGSRVEVALRYAPVCTLAAIIVPDILLQRMYVPDKNDAPEDFVLMLAPTRTWGEKDLDSTLVSTYAKDID